MEYLLEFFMRILMSFLEAFKIDQKLQQNPKEIGDPTRIPGTKTEQLSQ
jgi:hypothetical protein